MKFLCFADLFLDNLKRFLCRLVYWFFDFFVYMLFSRGLLKWLGHFLWCIWLCGDLGWLIILNRVFKGIFLQGVDDLYRCIVSDFRRERFRYCSLTIQQILICRSYSQRSLGNYRFLLLLCLSGLFPTFHDFGQGSRWSLSLSFSWLWGLFSWLFLSHIRRFSRCSFGNRFWRCLFLVFF